MAQRETDKTEGKEVASGEGWTARKPKSSRHTAASVGSTVTGRIPSGHAGDTLATVNASTVKESLAQAEIDRLIDRAGDDIQDVLDRLEDR